MNEQPTMLSGLVEADKTFFIESYKGQRKGIPRKSKTCGTVALKRGLSKEQIPVLWLYHELPGQTLSRVILSCSAVDIGNARVPHLAKDAELVTDGAKACGVVAKTHSITRRVVPRNTNHKTVGTLHINNVNAYDKRLKDWMYDFHGVAIKICPYLSWHR